MPVVLFPYTDLNMIEIELFNDVEDCFHVGDEYDLLGEHVADLQQEASIFLVEPFDFNED